MTANEIRDSFKKFFESKGHTIVPSAPMVIKDDPTLMFTNAGMNQWKDIILGTREPEPRRRADTQKCLRVSGKHNDLEEVGHDTYHHTMFEMLGNWSFGDYFKEGAIDYAWEYLVDVLKLNPADLYVTVFEGSEAEGLKRDDEAASYWETEFPRLKPKTVGKNVRQYTEADIEQIRAIYNLVKVRGFKISAARKMLNHNRAGVDKSSEILETLISVRDELKELKRQLDSLV